MPPRENDLRKRGGRLIWQGKKAYGGDGVGVRVGKMNGDVGVGSGGVMVGKIKGDVGVTEGTGGGVTVMVGGVTVMVGGAGVDGGV